MQFSHQNTHPLSFSSKSVNDTVAELATLSLIEMEYRILYEYNGKKKKSVHVEKSVLRIRESKAEFNPSFSK